MASLNRSRPRKPRRAKPQDLSRLDGVILLMPVIVQAEREGLVTVEVSSGADYTMVFFTEAGKQMAEGWGIEVPDLSDKNATVYGRTVSKFLTRYADEHGFVAASEQWKLHMLRNHHEMRRQQ